MKTGSEYLYYIPREVTLSLYDCEPLYLDSNQMYMYRPILYMTRKNRLVNNKPLFKILKKIIFQIHSAILIYLFLKYFHEKKKFAIYNLCRDMFIRSIQ